MRKNIFNSFGGIMLLVSFISYQNISCNGATYIPEAVREYIKGIYKIDNNRVSNEFKELYNMLVENRVLASDVLVRKVAHEAYNIVKRPDRKKNEWRHDAIVCLEEYFKGLDARSILLALKGDDSRVRAFPHSLVAQALQNDSRSREMIYLNSELAAVQNIELCGDSKLKTIKPVPPTAPSIMFNANALTSITSPFPNVIFATGINSPVINAWAMSPSDSTQFPINIQFSIPSNTKVEQGISLEMHFLIPQQGFGDGDVKIRINSLYVHSSQEFSINPISVTYSNDTPTFLVQEPNNPNDLMHIAIDMPIEKSGIQRMDFALISVTRVAPDGFEYPGDIYLSSAAVRYVAANS